MIVCPEIKQKHPQDRKSIFETLSLPVAKILPHVPRQAPTKSMNSTADVGAAEHTRDCNKARNRANFERRFGLGASSSSSSSSSASSPWLLLLYVCEHFCQQPSLKTLGFGVDA